MSQPQSKRHDPTIGGVVSGIALLTLISFLIGIGLSFLGAPGTGKALLVGISFVVGCKLYYLIRNKISEHRP